LPRQARFAAILVLGFFCASAPAAFAQAVGGGESGAVNVRGQFYLPYGGLLQQNIRFQLLTDDASRPPEYIFSDSGGRFVLYRLRSFATYSIVVESDGKNWGPTTSRFIVSGGRTPTVQIQLEPFQKEPGPGGISISAAALQQKVPRDARRQFESAVKLLEKNNLADAQPFLVRAVELFPDYVEARNELAVALMKSGNLPDAEQQLRRALHVDSSAVRPLLNLGLCLQRQQRFGEAQPHLEKAMQLRPDHATSLLLLGFNFVMTHDDARAEPLLVRAYELGGATVARSQLLLAQLYARHRDFSRSAAALEIYLREVPDAPDGLKLQVTLDRLRAASQPPKSP